MTFPVYILLMYILFELGLYYGVGSWSGKTQRAKPRIAEKTGSSS